MINVGLVIRNEPTDLIVVDGVGPPENHELCILDDHGPRGHLLVGLRRPDHPRHHHLQGFGGIVASARHEAALEIHIRRRWLWQLCSFPGLIQP